MIHLFWNVAALYLTSFFRPVNNSRNHHCLGEGGAGFSNKGFDAGARVSEKWCA